MHNPIRHVRLFAPSFPQILDNCLCSSPTISLIIKAIRVSTTCYLDYGSVQSPPPTLSRRFMAASPSSTNMRTASVQPSLAASNKGVCSRVHVLLQLAPCSISHLMILSSRFSAATSGPIIFIAVNL
jgi:hypothetical protein